MNQVQGNNKHIIVICEDHRDGISPYLVVPGRLLAEVGDEIFIKNVTSVPISVEFSNQSPVGDKIIPLESREGTKRFVVNVYPGSFPYDIFCGAGRVPAHGSRPIIIIYDRES